MTNKFKKFDFNTSHLQLNPDGTNMSDSQKDYAVFLPSISSIYAKIVSMPEYKLRESLPAGLPNGLKDLDFLDPSNSLFYYPASLYSAGHAILDVEDSFAGESMVQKRDRKNTVLIGDSGGFQAATGVLKYPWYPKGDQTAADHMKDKDAFRMKILRWLEATADYSMVLDWPTYAIIKYGSDPVTGESLHPGIKSFRDCLTGSLENHDFFIRNRVEGATKFLNVQQGRNKEEGDVWWEHTKDLPFESWAFSGVQAYDFGINLTRLIIMRDQGYLQGREWLHYLGNGRVKAGCALTTLQRTLRKHVDSELTLSFDAASPFVMTAKGQMYYGLEISPEKMGFKGGPIVDDKSRKNDPQILNDWIAENLNKKCIPVHTRISDRITVGDICVRGYDDLEYKKAAWTKKELATDLYKNSPEGRAGDPFKWSKAYHEYLTHSHEFGGLFSIDGSKFNDEREKYQVKWPSSMDGFSYLLLMNHNTEIHLNAIQAANRLQDEPISVASQYISQDLLEFKDLCEEIFTSETPMDIINKHAKVLRQLNGFDSYNDVSKDMGDFQ